MTCKNRFRTGTFWCSVTMSVALSGCVPVLIGGGVVTTGVLASRDKGVSGSMSDTGISTLIKKKFYSFHPDLHAQVGINVQYGDVLLTGVVKDSVWKEEAEKLVWQVDGVKNVFNHIKVSSESNYKSLISDSWITTQIRSKLTADGCVNSLNFSVKTIEESVYLMGVAQTQEELDQVLQICRNTRGVQKVICLAQVKNQFVSGSKTTSNEKTILPKDNQVSEQKF
jgi:osmotically-inducible protein OsmY